MQVESCEGLGQVGNLIQAWNPVTESLTIHRARVLRGGEIIDPLAGGRRFTVLRRETNLEAAVINGKLTTEVEALHNVGDLVSTISRKTVNR